jgi:hypothetical protein
MRKVERSDLVDYQTWTEKRDQVLPRILTVKDIRRIHVGDYLTFLFENKDTVRYQIQEMMRVEQIVREADILHELKTYNELLGDTGQLGCVLLIEIPTEAERNIKLVEWLDLPQHLYVRLADETKVYASYDERQLGSTRLSSVQYLIFDTKGSSPVAIGSDLPELMVESQLTESQLQALGQDLQA